MFHINNRQARNRGQIPLSTVFRSIQALNELDDFHLLWGELSTLLNPQTQMLLLSGNIFIDTCRNNV